MPPRSRPDRRRSRRAPSRPGRRPPRPRWRLRRHSLGNRPARVRPAPARSAGLRLRQRPRSAPRRLRVRRRAAALAQAPVQRSARRSRQRRRTPPSWSWRRRSRSFPAAARSRPRPLLDPWGARSSCRHATPRWSPAFRLVAGTAATARVLRAVLQRCGRQFRLLGRRSSSGALLSLRGRPARHSSLRPGARTGRARRHAPSGRKHRPAPRRSVGHGRSTAGRPALGRGNQDQSTMPRRSWDADTPAEDAPLSCRKGANHKVQSDQ